MDFVSEYDIALRKYVTSGDERGLHIAYELGRKVLENGDLILNASTIHSKSLSQILNEIQDSKDRGKALNSATSFFNEFLSPFDMTFRGFLDVVSNLKDEIAIRQQAEEAYRKSEKYFKALIGNALDIITILDSKGNLKYYSSAVERVLGYNDIELIDKNAFEFIHPDDVDNVLDIFQRTVTIPEYTTTVEFRFKHKDGQWVILESIGKNLLNDTLINGIIVNSRDVTDRRYLEEIRRKYEFIVNASKELLELVNSNYQYEAVNESFYTVLSKNRIEVVGQTVAGVLGKELFNNHFKEQIDECFKGKEIINEEWLTLPNNERRFFEVAFYPYKNQRSIVTHVIIVQRDITERKEKEDEIKKSQVQLAEAQNIAHIGSWEWMSSSDLVHCSVELCNVFGLTSDQSRLKYSEFLNFIHQSDRKKLDGLIKNAVTDLQSFILEHKIIRSGNEVRILQTRGKALKEDPNGGVRIIGTSQDITEQELARSALKESEIKYRRLFETSIEGLLLVDAATGVIADVNPFVIRFLGYPKEKLLGEKIWEITAVKGIKESEEALRGIINTEYSRYNELDLISTENKLVKVELVSVAYTESNKKVIQCHLWDITERKLLIQELNQAALQREEDLRKFAQSVQKAQEDERKRISRELHDDICQRLTALKFHLNVFEDAVENQKKISVRRLKSVKKDIDNLITEVRRISSNLRPSALDHFGIVTAMRLLCSEFEKLNTVKIKFETGIQTFQRFNPEVEIVLYRIAQEALTNSIKHSNTKNIRVNLIEEGNELALNVKDSGKGFKVEQKMAMNKKENGHFGLINMRERTEIIGGKFYIESGRNKGTNVKVKVPIKKYANDEKN